MKAEKNNTFCSYPFKELTLKSYKNSVLTAVSPCCNMFNSTRNKKNKNPLNFDPKDLNPEELFNHDRLKLLRHNLLNGVKDSACKVCWELEELDFISYRLMSGELSDEEVKNPKLQMIDITPSNLCNLRCRMCGVHTSHSLSIDVKYFQKNLKDLNDIEESTGAPWHSLTELNHATKTIQWDWLIKNTNKIKHIKASGGEPFYDSRFVTLLKTYVKNDHAKDTILDVHTNGTMFNNEIINLVKNFKLNVNTFSIDGYGLQYNYIRYPNTFDEINKNLKDYINLIPKDKSFIHIACVVSALNLLSMDKFINWFIDLNQTNSILHIADVMPYNRGTHISRLPVYILETALDRIEKSNYKKNVSILNSCENLIKMIKESINNNKENKELMLKEIIPFDNSRNQNYQDFLDDILVNWLNK